MLKLGFAVVVGVFLLAVSPVAEALAQNVDPNSELFLQGKELFEETAGEVGCAVCHGEDGRSGVAPPNAGASETVVRNALSLVLDMSFIELNRREMAALTTYLRYLGEQPTVTASLDDSDEAAAPTPETDTQLAEGKLIFEETAGGVGCAACHGLDGRSGEIGPPNAGADEAMVRSALQSVEEMSSIIKLKHNEIKAVVAYLEYLGNQPVVTASLDESAAVPSPENDPVLAAGKLIFEETAGGVGCAACHGLDGRSGEIGPPNAGADEAMVRSALRSVEEMSSLIDLKHDEIKAVVAYLEYLDNQPVVTAALDDSAEHASPENDPELAAGKLIFEETAGGIGCAACHGMDGRSGEIGPPNAGADEAMVRSALTSVEEMSSIIDLKHAEIKAVVAYLKYLGDHPNGP